MAYKYINCDHLLWKSFFIGQHRKIFHHRLSLTAEAPLNNNNTAHAYYPPVEYGNIKLLLLNRSQRNCIDPL